MEANAWPFELVISIKRSSKIVFDVLVMNAMIKRTLISWLQACRDRSAGLKQRLQRLA